jgi:hypothetical protein
MPDSRKTKEASGNQYNTPQTMQVVVHKYRAITLVFLRVKKGVFIFPLPIPEPEDASEGEEDRQSGIEGCPDVQRHRMQSRLLPSSQSLRSWLLCPPILRRVLQQFYIKGQGCVVPL